jgi:hypothetical protein
LRRGGPGPAADSKGTVSVVPPAQPHIHHDHHEWPGPTLPE